MKPLQGRDGLDSQGGVSATGAERQTSRHVTPAAGAAQGLRQFGSAVRPLLVKVSVATALHIRNDASHPYKSNDLQTSYV